MKRGYHITTCQQYQTLRDTHPRVSSVKQLTEANKRVNCTDGDMGGDAAATFGVAVAFNSMCADFIRSTHDIVDVEPCASDGHNSKP